MYSNLFKSLKLDEYIICATIVEYFEYSSNLSYKNYWIKIIYASFLNYELRLNYLVKLASIMLRINIELDIEKSLDTINIIPCT